MWNIFLCCILVVKKNINLYTYIMKGDKMKKSKKTNKLNNYKSMIILLGAIIIGGIVGLIWKDGAKVLSPFGDLFLNMLLIVVVPLIFLTITSSIYKMSEPKRIGKILITTFLVFLIALISLN